MYETNTTKSSNFWKECVAALTVLYCYIGKMVQFHVLDLFFSLTGHFMTLQ